VVLKASGGVGKSTLLRCWAEAMAEDNYRGAKWVFAWSFYSQGTEERVTSAEEFIAKALEWFGDQTAGQGLSAWDRGQRLAEFIQRRRTLLLLDGLEPLQSGHALDRGKLKDPGLEILLFELAKRNPGLCIITTREPVADLADEEVKAAVRQFDLDQISTVAGRALLRISGIEGEDQELEAAVKDFGNHAYAIKLLGAYLGYSHGRQITESATIAALEIPIEQGRHPRRVMEAFAERFGDGPKANLLAMLGLFERPADAAAIAALRAPPAIPGLTEHLVDLSSAAWAEEVADLRGLGLIAAPSHPAPDEIDAHPLVREHFGARLKAERPEAWRAGHGRLYEHLRDSAGQYPETLAEMAPLFQAMHHGCQAARYQEAYDHVFNPRINRKGFIVHQLAAFGSVLAALAGFFDHDWDKPTQNLRTADQAFLLHSAAFCLRALGRLREALAPMQTALASVVEREVWRNAARGGINLSELHLKVGDIAEALAVAAASITHAEQSKEAMLCIVTRSTLADALHQAGELSLAQELFEEAEELQAAWQPDYPQLYSTAGHYYCDLLLTQGHSAEVRKRAAQSLEWSTQGNLGWRNIALEHLSLGWAGLALGEHDQARTQLDDAVAGLRKAMDYLPRGLLARAALFRETGELPSARRDLDEAMRIAKRSEMRLFQCDAHLEYARLALAEGDTDRGREHVAEARRLVEETGYGRRRPEVEALETQLLE
jgi:tetratricopeptide (TPR) repeat protein